MENMISMFLSQSYQDSWDDYVRSINKTNFARWDYVILTASNEQQAEGFRRQLEMRRKAKLLPPQTVFLVVPDPDGKRVGSGGATLNVLRYIAQRDACNSFAGKRVLVIHSGGDSKRVPQYSALGKLFSPVPRELPNGWSSTLFDEFIIGMSGVPGRIKDGMLLLSGDVMLMFNPLQIDFSGNGAAAISFKEDVETAKNHGVYLMGEDGNVAEFLHKQTVDTLVAKGAVNEHNCVDIDTGAVIFSSEVLASIYGLVCEAGEFSEFKFKRLVNEEVRLSLYGDFLYPLAEKSTLEAFIKEKPEGDWNNKLIEARIAVWNAIRHFRLKLMRLSPAKFVHFGTTKEIMHLMHSDVVNYKYLNWKSQINSSVTAKNVAAYNSVMSRKTKCGENVYLEVSYVHGNSTIGNNVILSYIDICDEKVPDNVVMHGLKQKNGKFVVRIYGTHENPKNEDSFSFLDINIKEFMRINDIAENELWEETSHSLWNAKLYPECKDIRSAIAAALNLFEMAHGKGDVEKWRKASRKSLCEGFNDASSEALIAWENRMQELVQMDRLAKAIDMRKTVEETATIFHTRSLTRIQTNWLEGRLGNADFSETIRFYYYLGKIIGMEEGEKLLDKCFTSIRHNILLNALDEIKENTTCRICLDEHTVKLPLRVNWGGGWSDTPPYCNENGGTVLNAAITLNGEYPVNVKIKRLVDRKIVLESRDMHALGEFTEIEALQCCGNPYDPYALHKAALAVCGIIPSVGGVLDDILTRLGGGIYINTEVIGVPQGSGLGTSSILAAACVKAIFEFMGIDYTDDDLYSHVLCIEQIMSTGGGWQDQVGGLSNGIKYITTKPGLKQRIKVQHLEIDQEIKDELNERFALIYTGQRRLARNLLRDVVGRYLGGVPEVIKALEKIQEIAVLMRFELERGNIDGFAKLLKKHWAISKTIDASSTNTCIEQILHTIDDLIDGQMICGAGGGGFLQVILKKGISKDYLEKRLHEVFQDNGIAVWECELV